MNIYVSSNEQYDLNGLNNEIKKFCLKLFRCISFHKLKNKFSFDATENTTQFEVEDQIVLQ